MTRTTTHASTNPLVVIIVFVAIAAAVIYAGATVSARKAAQAEDGIHQSAERP